MAVSHAAWGGSTALTCTFDFWTETPDSFFYNLGFRCCRTN